MGSFYFSLNSIVSEETTTRGQTCSIGSIQKRMALNRSYLAIFLLRLKGYALDFAMETIGSMAKCLSKVNDMANGTKERFVSVLILLRVNKFVS